MDNIHTASVKAEHQSIPKVQVINLGKAAEITLGTSGRDFESIGRPRWW